MPSTELGVRVGPLEARALTAPAFYRPVDGTGGLDLINSDVTSPVDSDDDTEVNNSAAGLSYSVQVPTWFGPDVTYQQVGGVTNDVSDLDNPAPPNSPVGSTTIGVTASIMNQQGVSGNISGATMAPQDMTINSSFAGFRTYTLASTTSDPVSVTLEEQLTYTWTGPAPFTGLPSSPTDVGIMGGGHFYTPGFHVDWFDGQTPLVSHLGTSSTIVSESASPSGISLTVDPPLTLPSYSSGDGVPWTIDYGANIMSTIVGMNTESSNSEALTLTYSAYFKS